MVATEYFGGAPYFSSLVSRRCFDFVFNIDSVEAVVHFRRRLVGKIENRPVRFDNLFLKSS